MEPSASYYEPDDEDEDDSAYQEAKASYLADFDGDPDDRDDDRDAWSNI